MSVKQRDCNALNAFYKKHDRTAWGRFERKEQIIFEHVSRTPTQRDGACRAPLDLGLQYRRRRVEEKTTRRVGQSQDHGGLQRRWLKTAGCVSVRASVNRKIARSLKGSVVQVDFKTKTACCSRWQPSGDNFQARGPAPS